MAEAGDFTQLSEMVLLRIAKYLTPDSVCKWSMTCRRLYRALPHFLVMRGHDFHIMGHIMIVWNLTIILKDQC